jgi:hypothetical protein
MLDGLVDEPHVLGPCEGIKREVEWFDISDDTNCPQITYW